MKKVKITLKQGSSGKKFYLFPTSESLCVWAHAMERNEHVHVDQIEELVLEPGGFIEAELVGFEYIYDNDQKFRRCNLVRLGKATQPKNSSGVLVTIHEGWVTGGLLPMKAYSDIDIDVTVITERASRIDLPTLFNDADDGTNADGSVDVNFDAPSDDDDE